MRQRTVSSETLPALCSLNVFVSCFVQDAYLCSDYRPQGFYCPFFSPCCNNSFQHPNLAMHTGLSEWAKKYGPSTEIRSIPPGLRSGLTPISRLGLGRLLSEEEKRLAEENEAFQRQHLFEFTTQELKDLDIISERSFAHSTIQAHIVPFWSRGNWYDGNVSANGAPLRTYPLPAPYFNSRWVSTDDAVWGLLQPILKLASKILVENPKVTNFVRHYHRWGHSKRNLTSHRSTI